MYASYYVAQWLQPVVDRAAIVPLTQSIGSLVDPSGFAAALLIGNYGMITLGWYSFLWAFPVVLLVSIGVAVAEETGLKDRITASLDPALRLMQLSGRDLIPVLTGFGCNVVAIFQSRGCSNCNRKNCVSMIALGSACSYQIGASLSIFNSGSRPWLFLPYVATLFLVGAIHTRIWSSHLHNPEVLSLADRAFLQKPTLRAILWRVRATLKQFLFQAMPIFILVCVVGAVAAHFKLVHYLAIPLAPVLQTLDVPAAVASGVIFSIIRKRWPACA